MLRDLNLKAVYRSDEDNILEDFYIPALSVAVSYQRGVGFFSAAMLSYAAQGLSAFVANNGKMQLLIGAQLDPEDEEAIRQGYDLRSISERLGVQMARTIDSIADALCYRRLEALSWLVATGKLDVKVALRRRGMYHEKLGIIRDADGDAIVFQGSANETAYALLPDFNFESVNVFPCWREEFRAHFTPYLRGFERLWANRSPNTVVVDFPEAAAKCLYRIAAQGRLPNVSAEVILSRREAPCPVAPSTVPTVPTFLGGDEFTMRPHQLSGLNAWKANAFQGILAHSTGSGKTITAIYGAVRLFDAARRLAMVVSVPYQNLADQWVAALSQFQISAIRCYERRSDWEGALAERISLFRAGALPLLCLVVVNRTLQSATCQAQLADIPGDNFLWVGDECHHHATVALASCLPKNARMRLGLSATPQHYFDHGAVNRLTAYYGKIVSDFSLADALDAGVVTPYDYYVSTVSLTEDEARAYIEISRRLSALAAMGKTLDPEAVEDDEFRSLLMRRSRILGLAAAKLQALRTMLEGKPPQPLTLFYCGDGVTEDEDGAGAVRHVDQVSELLYGLGWRCARFTARESREDRERLIAAFRVGSIDALVAIRCLDEGIDVPACRTAYLLASGRNPRQFVQRRGRILRKAAGKVSATIHDCVVRLPSDELNVSPFERALVAAELERVSEFAKLARNATQVVRSLLPLLKEYDLAHLLV